MDSTQPMQAHKSPGFTDGFSGQQDRAGCRRPGLWAPAWGPAHTHTFRTDFSAINFLTLHTLQGSPAGKEGHCLGLGEPRGAWEAKTVA